MPERIYVKLVLVPVLLVAAMLWLPDAASARAKTDLVFIGKADRITGEIKQLDRGILTLSTNNIGTVNIEWEDVDSLNSVYLFRVEDRFGRKYFGSLFMSRAGAIEVIHANQTETVAALDVVSITPLEAGFWQRIDGSIAIGFSYTKATTIAQLNSDFNVRYRTPLRQVILDASNIATSQEGEDTKHREDLSLTYNRLFKGRWFATLAAGAQTNDELGLDLRASLAPGVGLDLIQTNHNTMTATAGLSGNREWSVNSDGEYNLEAFFGLENSTFRYDYPKTDITIDATLYPSLTTSGRLRSEVDISASREIVKDLTIVLSFYHSYDNKPLDPDAQKTDYGIVTSVGWTF
ncbi:MAG TPA: DUF481 domain-containing protein [Candidatus Krumholzibacteria bacterium]|nr:DUF481 domain-containing protein [Candidatus Krumholzibacteria bacterium]